jgi:rRNA processing protein Gar1
MNASENINVNIGNMKYGRIVKIFGGNLNVWGTVKLANLSNPDFIKDSYFIVNAKTININIGA